MMAIIGKGQKTDDQRFSQMHQVVEAVALSQSEQIDRLNTAEQERQQDRAAIEKLTSELAEMRQKLSTTDASFSKRPPAGGGANAQLADY